MTSIHRCLLFLKLFLVLVTSGETARILAFYPTPSISHQVVFWPLTQELLKRGHELVVISPNPLFPNGDTPVNLTEIDTSIASNIWAKQLSSPGMITGEKRSLLDQISGGYPMLVDLLEKELRWDKVQELILNKTRKFDLILLESYIWITMSITNVYKAPVISVSSLGPTGTNLQMTGNPEHPIYHPTHLQQDTNNLSLLEILNELYTFYYLNKHVNIHEKSANGMMERVFGKGVLTMDEIKSELDNMLLVNYFNIWDMNRPVSKNLVHMGGLHLTPQKELPKDIKKYLDSSKSGVIYISFGTNADASQFQPDRLQMLLNVFSKLPYNILFKWNGDELPGRSANVKISKWLPQADLLKHPNIKLFILQGGLQSIDEAISAGVPMLSIPVLGDQWYNSQQIEANGIGMQVDLGLATEKQLTECINTLIDNDIYRKKVVKLRSIVNDQPQTSLERAIWWIEYVLRHGGSKHLRPFSANMPWTEYYEIELLTYVLAVLIYIVFICIILFCYLYKKCKLFVLNRIKILKRH